jgi:hypothetical protein
MELEYQTSKPKGLTTTNLAAIKNLKVSKNSQSSFPNCYHEKFQLNTHLQAKTYFVKKTLEGNQTASANPTLLFA